MEKEPNSTLDRVLDIQNSISLNPFDRPPNIMDDDLNSVTQEELEANLSTDCPISNIESTTQTSWEQLIQSVLEDTSTQDVVEQEEVMTNKEDNSQMPSIDNSGILDILTKTEIQTRIYNEDIQVINVPGVQQDMSDSNKKITENENTEPKIAKLTISEEANKRIKEENETLMDISVEEEQMLTQNIAACYYEDTINVEDNDNGLCQVEVYASTKEVFAEALKHGCTSPIKEEMISFFDDDNLSNASSVTIGHLEEVNGEENNENKDKDSHLSVITSDHCYSQEVKTTQEKDVIKENLVSVIMQRNLQKDYQQKVSCLVDKLLDGLDNDKIDKILQSLNITENEDEELIDSKETDEQIQFPEINKSPQQLEDSNDAQCSDLSCNETEKGLENKKGKEISSEYDANVADEGVISEKKLISTNSNENFADVAVSEMDIEELVNPPDKETTENVEDTFNSRPPDIELNFDEHINEILNLNENTEKDTDKSEDAVKNQSNILSETKDTEENVSPFRANEVEIQSSQLTENDTTQTITDARPLSESVADNCSEPLEHRMFEEEFELLCKNGHLTLDNCKSDVSSRLLQKLSEFSTHIEKDCKAFSSASTNIDQKLHEYIRQQYEHFQELFKPYCSPTVTTSNQSIETQTDFKKITKRMNMESKKNLMKASDNSLSSQSSYTSTDEDETFTREQRKKRISKRTAKQKMQSSDSENTAIQTKTSSAASIALPTMTSTQVVTNYSQEYDDGINLSQYVQSEIFDMESTSQQSPLPSSVEDSEVSDKENVEGNFTVQNEEEDNGDSDSTMIFKINRNKNKKSLRSSPSTNSTTESKKCRTSNGDNMSVNSESDKENLSTDRKERKGNEPMDENEKNDKEIERLINIDGLSKRPATNSGSTKSSDKSKPKTTAVKTLNDRFDFMDVEFGSDDEVKSEAEEEVITEKQFLERCNEDIKRQMLDESSTDSDKMDDEDDELLKCSSEEDESGKNSPLVEKFLKTFVVDDSDNDVIDEDDDVELDSDKDEESTAMANKEVPKEVEDKKEEETEIKNTDDNKEIDGVSPTASDIELLNDNLLFRKRSSRPQKLDKMLSDAEKRRKISKIDEELISLSSESDNSDVEAIDEDPTQSTKLRAIKPMLRPDQLAGETIKAQKSENERISRLEKKHNMLEKVLKEHPDLDKNKELILDYIKESKTFIKVHPGIVKFLKPHQFDGVRFMYDSCYGGVDSLKKSPGSGCILAHCMGLGKTLQLIALLHTVISYKELETKRILVLCPKSTVMNWADEILRWLGPLRQKNLKVYTFNDTSDISEKLSILREWSLSNHTRAGCLLIGYEAFRTLVFYHSYKNRGNYSAQRLEQIRKSVNTYLLQPGADLVICDEGHIIKNSKSAISLAVAKIVTPRRIVLTGTPIQNNLKEYYSMVNFIKPLFLGTEKEFANLYANPIKNGQHKDSGKTDIKVMKQRSFVLHKKLSKFVQRKEAELLKTFLPQKFEYVLFIPMTDVQNNLYQHILNTIKNREDNYRGKGLITDYTCLRKIWTHPKVLEDAWKNAVNQRNKRESRKAQMGHNSEDDQPDDIYDSQTGQMSVTNDWWRSLVSETDLESVMPSNKLRTMFKILQMCEEKGEKCLIFSAFVAVLNVVEYFFDKITRNDQAIKHELNLSSQSQWELGKDYYRLDGKTPKSIRHAMINEFNNVLNKRARVFLISAKAGGQGINLIGANRVIILDTSWNPSNDQQNIFRVFRLGQKRNCYIYRLLAMGTMEEKVYSRSVTKQAMSFRVVDEQQIDRHYSMAELAELYTLTLPDHNNRPTPILPQDSILARLLHSFPDLAYKYHEHDSLLENKVEQELSEQEKNEAWTAYERDLQMSSEIREMPNMEDAQNKFNASNLANYMSPFSGLDVSNNNTANTNNSSNNKNMSHFFGTRGFGQPLLQSLLGPNSNPATTQQYIDIINYYKNLGSYVDLNSYSALMGGGRMPNTSPASAATNPLAALGDLSMYGLTSPALQGLGPAASTMNLTNSVLAGALPQLPPPSSSASMYTPSASSMLASTVTNPALSSTGLTNTTNSAALSAFEQYTQSLRGSFPNMYSYAGDFGLGSSGSTILDKSKTSKSSKQMVGGGNKNSTNLPGGSKNNNSISLYPGSSTYITPHQQQQQQQQQHQHQQQQQSRPSSRNTPVDSIGKAKPTSATMGLPTTTTSTPIVTTSSNSMTTYTTNSAPPSGKAMVSVKDLINASKSMTKEATNSLINYRRSDSSGSAQMTTKQNQKKTEMLDSSTNSSGASKTSALPPNNTTNTKQSSNSLSPTTQHTPPTGSTSKQTQKSTSTGQNTQSSKPSLNMGIMYPNSKGSDKSGSSKSNSPLNMGIVYPRNQKSSTSEMQIIPTSSPPGTTSISKQLNDLSPSISLTAVKNTPPSKSSIPNVKPIINPQGIQINKVLQNNTTIRRTTSPVGSATPSSSSQKPPAATNSANSKSAASNQNNFIARLKAANNKKPPTGNGNINPPPLHRANTTLGTTTSSTTVNISNKTSSGLTITNVKAPIKAAKQPSNTNTNQATTLAKQQAAASVAKSNIQRTPTLASNTNPTSKLNNSVLPNIQKSVTSPALPSLTSIKRTIIKRPSPNSSVPNKLSALTSSPSLTVTASNKLPIISSVKSMSPSMATISKNSQGKSNVSAILQHGKHNLPSVANVSKTIAQMQKRPSAVNSSSSVAASSSGNSTRNAVNIRPVDNTQNPTGTGGSVYIIETNINDKKVAIGTPTKSGGGTTVTKVLMQNSNKRKVTDPLPKDISTDNKRAKN